MGDKSQETSKPKVDISVPKDFKHVTHVGLKTNTGNTRRSKKGKTPKAVAVEADQTQNEDDIESNMDQAGVSVSETHRELDHDEEDPQELQRNTLKRRSKSKLTKEDIGYPFNFKHVLHVGWNINRGFDLNETSYPEAFKAFFDKAGVSDVQLRNRETREFIHNFIETHEGLDIIKEDIHNIKSNNTSKSKKEKIPEALRADQTQNTDEIKSFLNKAGVSDLQLQDKESRDFIYDFIERHGGLDAVKEELSDINYKSNDIEEKAAQSQNADELKSFLNKAGVSDSQLQDQETRDFIYNYIESHWGFNEYTSDDNATNTDEQKSSPGVAGTPQEDQETKELGNESREKLGGVKKKRQVDKNRRRAPQPPPISNTPVPSLDPPSPTSSTRVTTPTTPAISTASSETTAQVEPLEPQSSPSSPLTTKITVPLPADNSTTTFASCMETPPSDTITALTPGTVTSSVSNLNPLSPSSPRTTANPQSPSSPGVAPSKVTPPVATRRFVPLLLADTMTPSMPALNVELIKPLKTVIPMPATQPGSPLPTVRSTPTMSTVKPTSSPSSSVKAPVPSARSVPPSSPDAVPRSARRLAPKHPALTPDSPTAQRKDNSRDTLKTKDGLYKLVASGQYAMAVDLVNTLDEPALHEVISETIQKLLDSHSTAKAKLMSFAYTLWNSDAKSVVQIHFPLSFNLILGREDVKIVNKGYRQALKLDSNTNNEDRLAWGDAKDKSSRRVSWQLVPVWENNEVTFKLHNVDCNMFLKLGAEPEDGGERAVCGSPSADTHGHRYYLEPHDDDGELVFFIINYEYDVGVKLALDPDDKGDRALVGHDGDIYRDEGRFRWIISAW